MDGLSSRLLVDLCRKRSLSPRGRVGPRRSLGARTRTKSTTLRVCATCVTICTAGRPRPSTVSTLTRWFTPKDCASTATTSSTTRPSSKKQNQQPKQWSPKLRPRCLFSSCLLHRCQRTSTSPNSSRNVSSSKCKSKSSLTSSE